MDCSKPKIRKQNPREHANIFSIIFFKYVYKIFYVGARRDLEKDDIYDVLQSFQANRLYQRMNQEWEKEKKKPNPSIFLIFFRMFGVEFTLWGIGILLICLFQDCLQSILTGKIMTYFQPGETTTLSEACLYAGAALAAKFTQVLYDNTYVLSVWLIGLKMKIACCTMIYRKSLKLNINLKSENNIGKAVTLITKDVLQILPVVDCGHMLLMALPRAIVMTYIMYTYIGVTALVGAAFVFVMVPVNVYFGKLTANYRIKSAVNTDARVKVTQEVLTALRIVKMYTWEIFFKRKIDNLRKKEIRDLRILFYIKAIAGSIGQLSCRFALYACIMTYLALGNHITAEKAFAVITCFETINGVLSNLLPTGIAQMGEYRASLHRITNFLMLEEVPQKTIDNFCGSKDGRKICVSDATIKSENGITVLDKVNLNISEGLTIIMGPTGSGKSILLKMLLGDILTDSGEVKICGDISYASQEPWLFPSTVKQNIIFGECFDEKRYNEVIDVCALKFDFKMFPNGDQTYLTDRGLNLSKGQQARINLARAVYKKADIYLLDYCLSSVDTRVGKHIFSKCIQGFLKEFICILVTHNAPTLDSESNVVILNKGVLKFYDNYKHLKPRDLSETENYLSLNKLENNSEKKPDISSDGNEFETSALLPQLKTDSNDIYEEYNEVGKVNKGVYYKYFVSGGGYKMFLVVVFISVAAKAMASWSDYFVSFWVDIEQGLSGFRLNETTNSTEYKELESSQDNVMKLYSLVMLGTAILTIIQALIFYTFTSKASTNIHKSVIEKIMYTGICFFDKHLTGNVLNRLSRDLGMLDEYVPLVLMGCTHVLLSILAVLLVVSSVNWYFIIPCTIFLLILYLARYFYMPTGRNLRRLAGAVRSPLIGHLNATLDGLTTIRACKAERILENEFDNHQDMFTSALYMNLATQRAFGFFMEILGTVFINVVTFSFIFFKTETLAGKIGLAISQSASLSGLLKWGTIQFAELENQMTSTERVLEYKNLKPENTSGKQVENWPNNGSVEFQNVSLQYSIENEKVLDDLNFYIDSKEKVGIVGRTGAGKTSVISTLFRLYDYEGVILIDGIDTKSMAINYLRSKISIIPQDPVLFSGTIRSNLDPFLEYSDEILWNALDEVKMKPFFNSLDDVIMEGGAYLSVGEKQLICLARAIVRNNNILMLDEATANIDLETDTLIQKTIEKRFCNCTVITIAHRLYTVMHSDKIIVMDTGKVVQFGPPDVLLKQKDGLFYNMVKQAGLVD